MSGQGFIGTFKAASKELRVHSHERGRYTVEIEGVRHEVDAHRFGGGNWSLLIDGDSYDIELEVSEANEADGKYNALVRGRIVPLTVQDERRVRIKSTSKKFQVEGPQTVVSPMPGKIVKLLVAVNDSVQDGQPLALIEAMKMENEIRSPKAGRVSAIMICEGQAVDSGSKIMSVE